MKKLSILQMLLMCLALSGCGILDTEKDKELDVFETKVYKG